MSTNQWPNIRRIDSPEGNVAKFVYTKQSEKPAVVESVLYKYESYKKRTVICCSTQSGCPVGCRFCFAPGTLVNVYNPSTLRVEKVRIENIKAGDLLIGKNATLETVNQSLSRHYNGQMIEICLENGERFSVTADHEMIYSDETVVTAKNLSNGDTLMGNIKIWFMKKFDYFGQVFNVNCGPEHVFKLSAGVFTHNCGAGDYFVRSLSEDEIVEQSQYLLESQIDGVKVADIERIQIMFMSMGEPMLNQKNLIPALYRLNKMYPNAALLISTSGPLVDYSQFTEVSIDINKIGLQFSIHESTDEARDKLIPFKNKMTLQEISETGTEWAKATGRQAFFNYCAHDKNDTDEDADRVLALFSPEFWQATISVVCERDETVAQSHKRQEELAFGFEQKLLTRGFSTRMFNPAAQDSIGGGCGQLWFVQDWFKQNPTLAKPSVGHELPIVHMPN